MGGMLSRPVIHQRAPIYAAGSMTETIQAWRREKEGKEKCHCFMQSNGYERLRMAYDSISTIERLSSKALSI
jgi:hypothetical protein